MGLFIQPGGPWGWGPVQASASSHRHCATYHKLAGVLRGAVAASCLETSVSSWPGSLGGSTPPACCNSVLCHAPLTRAPHLAGRTHTDRAVPVASVGELSPACGSCWPCSVLGSGGGDHGNPLFPPRPPRLTFRARPGQHPCRAIEDTEFSKRGSPA